MAGWMRRSFCAPAICAAMHVAAPAFACGDVVDGLADAKTLRVGYDTAPAIFRFQAANIAAPTPAVAAFLQYVHATYLPSERLGVYRLRASELAKLIGYAIGEAATHPAPVEVFTPAFQADLEAWIVRLSVTMEAAIGGDGPADGNEMWRLIQEGERGFYDEEMRAAFGSVAKDDEGPTSVEQWFKGLSGPEKQLFLTRATAAGLNKGDGRAYSADEFELIAILMDGELESEGFSDEKKRLFISELARGNFANSSGE